MRCAQRRGRLSPGSEGVMRADSDASGLRGGFAFVWRDTRLFLNKKARRIISIFKNFNFQLILQICAAELGGRETKCLALALFRSEIEVPPRVAAAGQALLCALVRASPLAGILQGCASDAASARCGIASCCEKLAPCRATGPRAVKSALAPALLWSEIEVPPPQGTGSGALSCGSLLAGIFQGFCEMLTQSVS